MCVGMFGAIVYVIIFFVFFSFFLSGMHTLNINWMRVCVLIYVRIPADALDSSLLLLLTQSRTAQNGRKKKWKYFVIQFMDSVDAKHNRIFTRFERYIVEWKLRWKRIWCWLFKILLELIHICALYSPSIYSRRLFSLLFGWLDIRKYSIFPLFVNIVECPLYA